MGAISNLKIVDLLFNNALRYPNKTALRIDNVELTYLELKKNVLDIKKILCQYVHPGDRVGIWMQNSFSWVATFLAINSIGAISVPINTRLTKHELAVILNDAKISTLISSKTYRGRRYLEEAIECVNFANINCRIFEAMDFISTDKWYVYQSNFECPQTLFHIPDDVFCIQYTSGTTSIPKGVMLTNASYITTAAYVANCQGLTPQSNLISAGPFFHCSGSMHGITVCLWTGCTLNSFVIWDPNQYLDIVAKYKCDVSHGCFLRDVLNLNSSSSRSQLKSLRVAHAVGLPNYLITLRDELGIDGISNIYGMTETSGQFTMWSFEDSFVKRVSGNGRPQRGNQFRIVDIDTNQPVLLGMEGEIQMSGLTLTLGYFNRSESNAQAWTSDGWFRSGDRGQVGKNGELIYLGRYKDLLRVGGENCSPEEIELAIQEITGIKNVCVFSLKDSRLDEIPVAVVIDHSNRDWTDVLRKLKNRLAGFKIPRDIYSALEFPMTITNRVQRHILKDGILNNKFKKLNI